MTRVLVDTLSFGADSSMENLHGLRPIDCLKHYMKSGAFASLDSNSKAQCKNLLQTLKDKDGEDGHVKSTIRGRPRKRSMPKSSAQERETVTPSKRPRLELLRSYEDIAPTTSQQNDPVDPTGAAQPTCGDAEETPVKRERTEDEANENTPHFSGWSIPPEDAVKMEEGEG
ncbi:hypothetical protein PFISCL1PPCAC_11957, partial [Pristionchus fissidentatus]